MSAFEQEHNAAMERANDGAPVIAGDDAGTKASAAPVEVRRRVHVFVCEERGGAMMMVARWSDVGMGSADAAGHCACEGEEMAGLAHVERVVKRVRERRGL